MAEQVIQWHPGFYAGVEIALQGYHLDFEKEYQLTRGPLSIDLLIIKKLTEEKIDNEIGRIFRRHNIVEYKSPDDELSIDVFFKTQAYACLYKASGECVNSIPASEITVSLFRDRYPRELLEQLKASGFAVTEQYPGVYYLEGKSYFPTQLVVTGELISQDHAVLRILSGNAKEEDIKTFIRKVKTFTEQGDKERADAVFQVSSTANKALYEKIYKEDPAMCQALMDIMKEDIDRKVFVGMQKGMQQGKADERLNNIRKLMLNCGWTPLQAMDALDIPADDRKNYLSKLPQ